MTKYLILDSGALINLAQNSLLDIFRELAKVFQGEFLITPEVRYESIEHPLKIKKFEWGALRIEHLLEDEIVRMSSEVVDDKELERRTQEVMNKVNNCLSSDGRAIHLIEKGESECLALSLILKQRKIDSAVVIDERTARMLCENPENLRQLMENKLHQRIKMCPDNLREFKDIKVLRTPELMYIANKHKILDGDKRTLEAVLFALKFGGCSISEKEVQLMKKM